MPELRIKRRDPNLISGMQIELQPGHGPQHRPSAYMDNTRIREEVGYRPEYTIERAITEYIYWLRRHPERKSYPVLSVSLPILALNIRCSRGRWLCYG